MAFGTNLRPMIIAFLIWGAGDVFNHPFWRPGRNIIPESSAVLDRGLSRPGYGYIWWAAWHVVSHLARSHHVNVLLRQLHISKADALLTVILQAHAMLGVQPASIPPGGT
jgi:hypothetical protein